MDHTYLDRRADSVELAYARRNVGSSGMHVFLYKSWYVALMLVCL